MTLHHFISACESDPRVLAAALFGSHASDAADTWSDLDLAVIIDDPAYDEFVDGRESFVRQMGEPLFIEDFDLPGILFVILADGTEAELMIERASEFTEPPGPWRPLVDKSGVLAHPKPRPVPDAAGQSETLRRQIVWFWHDLSHFITAMGRGQLWWAYGQLEGLRRVCLTLARLRHDFSDEEAGDEPSFKIDSALPAGVLAPLAGTFVPLEREAMREAAQTMVRYYRAAATAMAGSHDIPYPVELERLMLRKMDRLVQSG